MRRAHVIITRFERTRLRDDHFSMGAKAARDALKFRTTGRADAIPLFYFGAIWDDDNLSSDFEYRQQLVSEVSDCGVRIQINPAPSGNPAAG